MLKPCMDVVLGTDLAAAPWTSGAAHPTAWPTWPWQSVLLKQAGVPATRFVGTRADVKLAPCVWQSAQTAAFPAFVSVCVRTLPALVRHGFGEWGALTVAPWHTAVFRQVTALPDPAKLIP